MSRRNGDRARFQKDRKRKMVRRQRTKALLAAGRAAATHDAAAPDAVDAAPAAERP
jgi:hypothetical protein